MSLARMIGVGSWESSECPGYQLASNFPPWWTSLVVQWLRLCASTAGGTGSIPGGWTKIPACCSVPQKKKKKNFPPRFYQLVPILFFSTLSFVFPALNKVLYLTPSSSTWRIPPRGSRIVEKSIRSRARLPGVEFQLQYSLAVRTWASYLAVLQ